MKWERSAEQRLLCAVNKALRLPKTVVSTLPVCLCTSQGLHAADPCSPILLKKDHKRNPESCWKEFLHCTFHEQLPSPFHLGLLHSCLAFACPNFHGPQGPTKKTLQNHYDPQIIICVPKKFINKYLNWQDSQSLKTSKQAWHQAGHLCPPCFPSRVLPLSHHLHGVAAATVLGTTGSKLLVPTSASLPGRLLVALPSRQHPNKHDVVPHHVLPTPQTSRAAQVGASPGLLHPTALATPTELLQVVPCSWKGDCLGLKAAFTSSWKH